MTTKFRIFFQIYPDCCFPFTFLPRLDLQVFFFRECLDLQVQHDHLTYTSVRDNATVDLLVNDLHYIFPTFDYRYNQLM
jgi:hypothetical protein